MALVPGGAYTSALTVRMRLLVARPRLRFVRHGLGHGAPRCAGGGGKVIVMNVLESPLILAATLSALWWAFARHRAPVALEQVSLVGLGLGVLAVALEGVHWQLVPWQLLALACAAVAALRRQRLARSRRLFRVVGRAALMLGGLAGGV